MYQSSTANAHHPADPDEMNYVTGLGIDLLSLAELWHQSCVSAFTDVRLLYSVLLDQSDSFRIPEIDHAMQLSADFLPSDCNERSEARYQTAGGRRVAIAQPAMANANQHHCCKFQWCKHVQDIRFVSRCKLPIKISARAEPRQRLFAGSCQQSWSSRCRKPRFLYLSDRCGP